MSARAKCVIFEKLVKWLLLKNEYEPCEVDNEQVDNQGRVRGRGEWHQIDALGRWKFTLPFVYPIRLLCEAKCWSDPVGLPVIRNFVGVVKDITENYFVEEGQNIDVRMFSKRHTDCGAIFSVNGFTKPAQRYAYAQGVSLVSYENNPIIADFVEIAEDMSRLVRLRKGEETRDFQQWFEESWIRHNPRHPGRFLTHPRDFLNRFQRIKDMFARVRTSVVGIASGVYPLHLLSFNRMPNELFRETDDSFFRVRYYRTERGGHYFEIYPSDMPDTTFNFTIPEVILSRYSNSMRKFKRDFLSWIDLPTTVGNMRRIFRLKLDKEWLDRAR